jgi:hypothetical protein
MISDYLGGRVTEILRVIRNLVLPELLVQSPRGAL